MLLWRAKHYFPWQFLKIRCHIRDFGCKAVSLTWKMLICFAKHVNLVEFLRYSIQALWLFLKSRLCMVFRNMNSCKRYSWSSRPVSIGITYFLHVFILLKSCGLLVFLWICWVWFGWLFGLFGWFLVVDLVLVCLPPQLVISLGKFWTLPLRLAGVLF